MDKCTGAITKNQDAIYREVARGKSRSKSPMRLNNFRSEDFSPLGNNRDNSPYSRSAFNQQKKHSIFSSESESDSYYN